MKKQLPAILAAFIITMVVALGMFVVGGNAAANKNGVAVLNSPASNQDASVSQTTDTTSTSQSQVAQLQSLVAQYQQREQQYQSQLSAVQTQLDQVTSTLQQYQQVLQYLLRRGVISVDQNGHILLP